MHSLWTRFSSGLPPAIRAQRMRSCCCRHTRCDPFGSQVIHSSCACGRPRSFSSRQRERKGVIDLDAVRQLAPINVPAFAFHATASSPFVFFQNLRFFYGVALPPDVADAHRRLADVALMLNVQSDFVRTDDRHPDRLADYLKSYLATHPYADALTATLVNADDGGLFTEAVRRLLQTPTNDEEAEEHASAPVVFQVTSYVEDERHSSGQELEGIRQAQLDLDTDSADRSPTAWSDKYHPRLCVSPGPALAGRSPDPCLRSVTTTRACSATPR